MLNYFWHPQCFFLSNFIHQFEGQLLICSQNFKIVGKECIGIHRIWMVNQIHITNTFHVQNIGQIMFVSKLSKSVRSLLPAWPTLAPSAYTPTFFLRNHFLQSLYELASAQINIQFERQRIFFVDGGHVTLDWSNRSKAEEGSPIVMIMHGMTGGSETKYIKALVEKSNELGFCSVCLNSRGINSEMTSPIPFVGFEFHELETALKRIKTLYPKNRLYFIGTSLGGNYILRYILSRVQVEHLHGMVLISPPFDVKYVIDGMNMHYQKFFIKSYIKNTILKHKQMKFWWENGVINLDSLMDSKNLRQFHNRMTCKILGFDNQDILFDYFKVKDESIKELQIKTLILTSKDDPMVGFPSFPIEPLNNNNNITLLITETGGHLCWFEGILPKRWYPTPVFDFISKLENQNKKIAGKVL